MTDTTPDTQLLDEKINDLIHRHYISKHFYPNPSEDAESLTESVN